MSTALILSTADDIPSMPLEADAEAWEAWEETIAEKIAQSQDQDVTTWVNEPVTFTATLMRYDTSHHVPFYAPLPNEKVSIKHKVRSKIFTDFTGNTDNPNGRITKTKSWASTGTTTYYAVFDGDTDKNFAKSQSGRVTVTVLPSRIPTKLMLEPWLRDERSDDGSPNWYAYVNGRLSDQNDNCLKDRNGDCMKERIIIDSKFIQYYQNVERDSGTTRQAVGFTNLQGYFTAKVAIDTYEAPYTSTRNYDFQAHFAGDSTYGASDSNTVNESRW